MLKRPLKRLFYSIYTKPKCKKGDLFKASFRHSILLWEKASIERLRFDPLAVEETHQQPIARLDKDDVFMIIEEPCSYLDSGYKWWQIKILFKDKVGYMNTRREVFEFVCEKVTPKEN